MLLFTIDINGTDHYVSTELVALTHIWQRKIISFDPPQYGLPQRHGGYCNLTFGSITLSVDLFTDSDGSGDWPPPRKIGITAQHTLTNEAAATTLFDGVAYLTSISNGVIAYELYVGDYTTMLLEEATDYEGNLSPLPLAFGTVVHQQPVRLPDSGGYPCYDKAGLTGTCGSDWYVYDDGVDITANVTSEINNQFVLNAEPTGEVTVSGDGSCVDLEDIFDWAYGATLLNETLDKTDLTADTGTLSIWATEQKPLVDFLNEVSAFFHHCFFKHWADSKIYVIDMLRHGTTNYWVTEDSIYADNLLSINYNYPVPTKRVATNWTTRAAVEETVGKYIKDTERECEVTMVVLAAGEAHDSAVIGADAWDSAGAHFHMWGVKSGMIIKNYDDGSESTLTGDPEYGGSPCGNLAPIDTALFPISPSKEHYAIGYISDYGSEIKVKTCSQSYADIKFYLAAISMLNNHAWIEVKLPMQLYGIPKIRDKYIVTDYTVPEDSDGNALHAMLKIAKITLNFEEGTYLIGGEGGIFTDDEVQYTV